MPQTNKKVLEIPELPKLKLSELPSLAEILRDLGFLKDKTTSLLGKREYMRTYMKLYRDRKRRRKYSPRKKTRKKKG